MKIDQKIYVGYRRHQVGLNSQAISAECLVDVVHQSAHKPLDLHLRIRKHSPSGFEWGYQGSGPAQLALALVADACGPEYAIPAIYQEIKRSIVSRLPRDGWSLDSEQVRVVVIAAMMTHKITVEELRKEDD